MRSAILYHLYSGDVWFTALLLLAAVVVVDRRLPEDRNTLFRRGLRVLFLLSLPLAALGGVAIPIVLAIAGVVAWIVYLFAGFGRRPGRVGRGPAILLIALAVTAIASEVWWRTKSGPAGRPVPSMVVFGDSLTAGGFEEGRTWVDHLRDESGLELIDLSRASATTTSALLFQLSEMPERCEKCGVVIELGGNDMLEGKRPAGYEENLRRLITEVRSRGAVEIWMIEFPVLPGRWAWAAAQRGVARDLDVILIPKRVLAGVLLDPDLTLDALHLSDAGHAALAERLRPWIGAKRRGSSDRR